METDSIPLYYFSPAGGTAAVAETARICLEKELSKEKGKEDEDGPCDSTGSNENGVIPQMIDATVELEEREFRSNESLMVFFPVYMGRVPRPFTESLRKLKGNVTPFVPVAVHGGRGAEGSLAEIRDIMAEQGFVAIGGGEFVAPHSFDETINSDRPDEKDRENMARLIRGYVDKLSILEIIDDGEVERVVRDEVGPSPLDLKVDIPGTPAEGPYPPASIIPTVSDACVVCGICADICPAHAVTIGNESSYTDNSKCISCMSCVKECPVGARSMPEEQMEQVRKRLSFLKEERTEARIFL